MKKLNYRFRGFIFVFILLWGFLLLVSLSPGYTEEPSGQAIPDRKDKLERIQEKLKKVDPSLAIFMDKKGNIAGVGDPTQLLGELERLRQLDHPPALALAELPVDQYGLVNWVESLKLAKIKPLDSLDPSVQPTPAFDLEVLIKTKSKFQPDVIFSHKIHTQWLSCENCHDEIFKRKAGGHPEMHMKKIAAGEYCGRCHNRVAFTLFDCLRCHVKSKEE